jgi:molecular chaperone DnaK (HSP70)
MKKVRFPLVVIFVLLITAFFTAACSIIKPSESKLSYPIGIETSDGFTEIIPAGKELPTVYSETYSNQEDQQDTVNIQISQQRKEGMEKIVDVVVPIPAKGEGEVEVLITVKIDADKKLRVKASVMDSNQVKEFGPFPVE